MASIHLIEAPRCRRRCCCLSPEADENHRLVLVAILVMVMFVPDRRDVLVACRAAHVSRGVAGLHIPRPSNAMMPAASCLSWCCSPTVGQGRTHARARSLLAELPPCCLAWVGRTVHAAAVRLCLCWSGLVGRLYASRSPTAIATPHSLTGPCDSFGSACCGLSFVYGSNSFLFDSSIYQQLAKRRRAWRTACLRHGQLFYIHFNHLIRATVTSDKHARCWKRPQSDTPRTQAGHNL